MTQIDWAKMYAEMDKRIVLKYEQMPKGEQIGNRSQAENEEAKGPQGDDGVPRNITRKEELCRG